ncbi:hypothetical protein V7S43_000231 [Phytophthora oleae]|uniref:ZSWIM1/3 RNaseH-like domain-containing protein n=1 Tax=Phytophthora oleae TaxID=2107226 RepID=A0ABD3G8N3_9STRA
MIKARAKPKTILKYLQKITGKRLILRDVHKLVQRLKSNRRGSRTVKDRLETVLRKFCSYRNNAATIFVDDARTTQTITLQTRQMHRFLEVFSEGMMFAPPTSKYKLSSFMIDDVFGHVSV